MLGRRLKRNPDDEATGLLSKGAGAGGGGNDGMMYGDHDDNDDKNNEETTTTTSSHNDNDNAYSLLTTAPAVLANGRKSSLSIAIVGGGVAGIVTARVLKAQGFKTLTLYESSSALGGIWSDQNGYPNMAIQTPGSLYEFPDKELPEPKDYKSGSEIQKYCKQYVHDHNLGPHMKLNSKVRSIVKKTMDGPRNPNKWELTIVSKKGSSVTTTTKTLVDFVILATGIYSNNDKFLPKIEGMYNFKGLISHSTDTTQRSWSSSRSSLLSSSSNSTASDIRIGGKSKTRTSTTTLAKGSVVALDKKVLVIGFGKSAHDCIMNAYEETTIPPILLFRQSHWCVPRKVLGLIPMEWLIYSRFGQGTLPRWQECGPVEWMIQTVLYYPLIWFYWRLVELLFSIQLGMYGTAWYLRPSIPIEDDMYAGHGIICHPQLFSLIHKGKIRAMKSTIEKILPSGNVLLTNGMELQVDEIVMATGYKRVLTFFPKELLAKQEEDGFYAYRNMIIPGVPNIAFVNSNVTTFSNITTPGLQAAWIAELLQGNLQLPERQDLLNEVEQDKVWRRKHLTYAGDSRAFLIQLHQIRYWDSLLRDMGINVKRKRSPNGGPIVAALKTFFVPVYPSDYKEVITGQWKKNTNDLRPKNYTPSYWGEWVVVVVILLTLCILLFPPY